jgi:hypothetical protein
LRGVPSPFPLLEKAGELRPVSLLKVRHPTGDRVVEPPELHPGTPDRIRERGLITDY